MSTKPRWIWHFGDFEIYHSLLLHARRQELGHDYPTMWHTDAPYSTVEFKKNFHCERAGTLEALTNGPGYLELDGVKLATGQAHPVAAGDHRAVVRVTKTSGLPCAFVKGVCASDESWRVSHMTAQEFPAGGTPAYEREQDNPEVFPFAYRRLEPVSAHTVSDGVLYDFGRETFGQLNLEHADPQARLEVYYGESAEEATDCMHTLVREAVAGQACYSLAARAFRYVLVRGGQPPLQVSAEYEYLPLDYRGSFHCDQPLLDQIWSVAAYTFHLNSREFFLDGIKRDRWVWSGDAYQSYMVNNYLFFDREIAKRTVLALRGKDPVEQHINTILDYSMYWILSVYDTYMSFGDLEFVRLMYPKMQSLLAFIESSTDENGFLVGREGDWVFVDWSEMDKEGAVCAEQMLYVRSLEVMGLVAGLLGQPAEGYAQRAAQFARKLDQFFWDGDQGAYIDSYASGRRHVTRHANIFAILFDIASPERQRLLYERVLKNDAITQITTPYFKFFELDAVCKLGGLEATTQLMLDYWGGMIRLGATSIWELYDPAESGAQHYAMYGMRYGKSLCHAWGGGPIYLLGRYYLGVRPTAPGYRQFEVAPQLGGLGSISGTAPIEGGEVRVALDGERLQVYASREGGTLVWKGERYAIAAGRELTLPV